MNNITAYPPYAVFLPTMTRKPLTESDQLKAVNSIFSNANKHAIARYIYNNTPASPIQIANATKITPPLVSRNISDMITAGTAEKTDHSEPHTKQVFYRLTPLGKKLVSLFD